MKYWNSDLITVKRDRELVIRDTSTLTEQVYLSRNKQIAQFIRSGMMLKASRLGYEYPDGNVPDDIKTTVFDRLDVDLVDITESQNRLKAKLSAVDGKGGSGGIDDKDPPANPDGENSVDDK